MESAQRRESADYEWIAAWSTEWLRDQKRQEELLHEESRHVRQSRGRGRKKGMASKNRARREARHRRAKLQEQGEAQTDAYPSSLSSGGSEASEPSTQPPPSAEEPNLSAESITGDLAEASDATSHVLSAETVSSRTPCGAEGSASTSGDTQDAGGVDAADAVVPTRTLSTGTVSVASELPSEPGFMYDQTPTPWSPTRFRPRSRTAPPQQDVQPEDDDDAAQPLARTKSVVVTAHSTSDVMAAAELAETPSLEPSQPDIAWGPTPTPWSPPQQRVRTIPPASNYGQTRTPCSPIQRGNSMESNVWDEAQRSLVENIMHPHDCTPGGLPDLPHQGMRELLWPRGYELPAEQEELLGSGSFGRVVKVCRRCDCRLFALKRQFLGDFADDVVPVLREIRILNALKGSCNIVQIEEAFLARPASGDSEVWAILEFFPHNLNQLHHQFRREDKARQVVFQLLLGLNSLHSADIVHRDLKPANVLVDLQQESPRVAICDFGISRSLHGLPEQGAHETADISPKLIHRTVTTHVTTSFWRAPEMWGWADAGRMSKQDLKSLDVFALGLIWAGLLGGGPVITCNDEIDPAKFRLLEILQKVDRPSDHDLNELFYGPGEKWFIRRLLDGELEAILPEIINDDYPDESGKREQLLRAPYQGIQKWIWKNARNLQENSPVPAIIESIARFSYRARPKVETLLEHGIFADLRACSPQRVLSQKHAPPIDDVREMLDEELRHQMEAAQQVELHSRPQNGNSANSEGPITSSSQEVDNNTADVKASVRRVCDQVRAELGRASRW